MMGAGKLQLILLVGFALGAWSGVAAQNAADQASPQASPADNTQRPKAPLRVRVSQGVTQALIVKKVQPQLPQEARQGHIEGEVVLKILISRQGDVIEASLISGHPLLAPAAIDAVRQWKYKPFLLNRQPAEVETQVVVAFKLDGEDSKSDATQDDAPKADEPAGKVTGVAGGVPGGQTGGVTGGIISSTPPATPGVAAPERVRVSMGVTSGLLVKKVAPEYPPDARRARIQGTVVLQVVINKSGDITTVELVSGHPMLAPAAIEAVKQWKYKPYILNGEPVEVETQITVNFTLSGG